MLIIDIIFELIFFILSFVAITNSEQLTLNISTLQMANIIRLYRIINTVMFLSFNTNLFDFFDYKKILYYYKLFFNYIDLFSKFIIRKIKNLIF